MTYKNMGIKMGEVIVLTEGAYSDYGISGFIVALKHFDIGEKAREYVKETEHLGYHNRTGDFVGWLITKELVLPVEYREIYLGEYGDFDVDFLIKPPEK